MGPKLYQNGPQFKVLNWMYFRTCRFYQAFTTTFGTCGLTTVSFQGSTRDLQIALQMELRMALGRPTTSGPFQDHPETAKHCSGPLETSSGPLRSGHFPVTLPTTSGPFQDHPERAKHRSGPLETSSGPLRDHYFGTTFGPPRDSKTPLLTAQNQLGATSGPLRDHFGAASGPPDRKTPLRTTQGLQAAKHRCEPVKTSSRPAPSPLAAHSGPPSRKTPPRTAEKQLETSSSIREAHIS